MSLPKRRQIRPDGHAIEMRINAEDPRNDFTPSPGTITRYIPPDDPGVRVDTYVHQGWTVPTSYDSMIAKLIVHQRTRAEAIATILDPISAAVTTEVLTELGVRIAVDQESIDDVAAEFLASLEG